MPPLPAAVYLNQGLRSAPLNPGATHSQHNAFGGVFGDEINRACPEHVLRQPIFMPLHPLHRRDLDRFGRLLTSSPLFSPLSEQGGKKCRQRITFIYRRLPVFCPRRLPEKNHFGIFASTRRSPSPARAFLFIRRWPRFISLRARTWDCKLPKPAAARPENLVSTRRERFFSPA